MKRLLLIIVFATSLGCAYGQPDCKRVADDASKLFNAHKYGEALTQFEYCNIYCGNFYSGMIEKCKLELKKQEDAAAKRRREESAALKRKEAAIKEQIVRREKNRLVRIKAHSPARGLFSDIENHIQDKITQYAPNAINFTPDSIEAYWDVHIMINIRKHPVSDSNIQKYYVEADVKIEEVTSGSTLGGFQSVAERSCSSNLSDEAAEELVADEIYMKGDLFREIAEKIFQRINAIDTQSRSIHASTFDNHKNIVVLVYSNTGVSAPGARILCSRMKRHFLNDEKKRYNLLNRSNEFKILTFNERIYGEKGYVRTAEIAMAGNEKGAELVCGIVISDDFIECEIIEIATSSVINHAEYVCEHNTKGQAINEENASHIADLLALQLGLLSEEQVRKIQEIQAGQDSIALKKQRAYIANSFVPGLTQLQNGKKIKGTLFIVGETLCIGGAIAMHSIGTSHEGEINRINDAEYKKVYNHNANVCYTTRNVMIGAAVAVYIWNIIDAFANKPKNMTYVYPHVGNSDIGLAINFNF